MLIYKINRIKEVYKEAMETIKVIKGNSIYRIMPVIMKQIVFAKKEVKELSGVSVNVVSHIINQLVELNILVPDKKVIKKGYFYKRIYYIFLYNIHLNIPSLYLSLLSDTIDKMMPKLSTILSFISPTSVFSHYV